MKKIFTLTLMSAALSVALSSSAFAVNSSTIQVQNNTPKDTTILLRVHNTAGVLVDEIVVPHNGETAPSNWVSSRWGNDYFDSIDVYYQDDKETQLCGKLPAEPINIGDQNNRNYTILKCDKTGFQPDWYVQSDTPFSALKK